MESSQERVAALRRQIVEEQHTYMAEVMRLKNEIQAYKGNLKVF